MEFKSSTRIHLLYLRRLYHQANGRQSFEFFVEHESAVLRAEPPGQHLKTVFW